MQNLEKIWTWPTQNNLFPSIRITNMVLRNSRRYWALIIFKTTLSYSLTERPAKLNTDDCKKFNWGKAYKMMPPLKWLFYLSDLSSILQREDNFSFIIIFLSNNCLYSSVVERWSCKLVVLGSICSSSCFVISCHILEQHESTHAHLTAGILKHEVLHQWSNDFEVVSSGANCKQLQSASL